MPGVARPVVPIAGDPAVIAERIVKRPTVQPELLSLRLPHCVQELEAGDIGIAPSRHEQNLRVQQLLLGVEDVENGAGADTLLGPSAFEGELVGLNRDGFRLDCLQRGFLVGKSGAGGFDDGSLGPDDSLERLPLSRLRLADPGGGKPALEDRDVST